MNNKKAFAQAKATEISAKVEKMRASSAQKKAEIEAKMNKSGGKAGRAKMLAKRPQPRRK